MRGLRIAAAVACIVVAGPAPPAHALAPPTIDPSRLPDPAPPAPPVPTAQRQICAVPTELRPDAVPTHPLADLDLEASWQLSRGRGQRVAVIDTGVARHHRLAGLVGLGDYVGTGDGTEDCDGHGTVVAGIIAAAPGPDGFAGVAPEATVLSIRQSSTRFGPAHDPAAVGFGDVETMAMAVRTAADQGATVINISTVACQSGALDDQALGAALAYAVDVKDVVVVAAAGNIGGPGRCPRQPDDGGQQWDTATVAVSPAWYDDYVLTVGSVGSGGSPSAFTMPGPWVDVGAPGEDLVSLNPAGGHLIDTLPMPDGDRPISGTSYAAPVVAGVAALVRSRFPELRARQVMQRIETSAHRAGHGWDAAIGNGMVDPVRALGSDPPTTTLTPERAHPLPPSTGPGTDRSARDTALLGLAVCAVLLVGASALAGRRGRDDVARD